MNIEKIRDISILLAEDESELRDSLCEYLHIFFHRVYTAECGIKAYDIYQQKRPNIILTDISMPNLDGLSMIAKIRANDRDTKIIVMSAHSEQDKLLQAIKLHLEAYLIKPIKMDALKKILFETVDLIRRTTSRLYATENIYWDSSTNTLWYNAKEIKLRKMENLLLKLLFSESKRCFSSKEIFDYLHEGKESSEFSSHAITSLMKRIRTKLPEDIIQNVYGLGYRASSI